MKVVEVRRHTQRDEQENLTEEGKRIVGIAKETLKADYAAAFASPFKRAILTLQEFGFKDYKIEPALALPGKEDLGPYRDAYNQMRSTEAVFSHPVISKIVLGAGARVLSTLRRIADSLPEGKSIFAVSHGTTMEATALSILGSGPDLNAIGGRFRTCEGFRAYLVGQTIARLDLVRLYQTSKPETFSSKNLLLASS